MDILNRIEDYSRFDIGLDRGDVRLASHNPLWKRVFSDEAHLIYDSVRIEGLRLYHCGSTSVPSLAAKPIIDIVGSVPRLESLDEKRCALESIGYEYKGEYGIKGRRRPLKNFFDRFSDLLRGEHKHLGEALYGKKLRLLATGTDERLPFGFEVPFSSTAIYFGMDYLGAKYRAVDS